MKQEREPGAQNGTALEESRDSVKEHRRIEFGTPSGVAVGELADCRGKRGIPPFGHGGDTDIIEATSFWKLAFRKCACRNRTNCLDRRIRRQLGTGICYDGPNVLKYKEERSTDRCENSKSSRNTRIDILEVFPS